MLRRPSDVDDELSLAERAAHGDHAAFGTLVRAYEPQILAYLAQMLGDAEAARDVAQETFLAAYQALPRWRPPATEDLATSRPLSPWLYRIATNKALSLLRSNAARPAVAASARAGTGKTEPAHGGFEEQYRLARPAASGTAPPLRRRRGLSRLALRGGRAVRRDRGTTRFDERGRPQAREPRPDHTSRSVFHAGPGGETMSERNGQVPFDFNPPNPRSRHVEDQLAAYTADECSKVERAAIERHLAICAACRAALGETRRIRELLASLSVASTPAPVAERVLARLPAVQGVGSTEPQVTVLPVPQSASLGSGCPVSAPEDVSLPVTHSGPRLRRGRRPSTWRRRGSATRMEEAVMERNTSRANWGRTESSRGPSAPTRSGRLGAVPAVAATIALIVLGGGLFGLISQRSAAPRVGSQPSTTGTRVRQNGPTVNLPANSTLDGVSMEFADRRLGSGHRLQSVERHG